MKKLIYKSITIVLLVLVSIPIGTMIHTGSASPHQVLAQDSSGVEGGLVNAAAACAASAFAQLALEQALAATSILTVPTKGVAQVVKEQFLDCLMWATVSILIQEVTDSMIAWAQSGFDGNPAFVDDFDGWLGGVAKDQVDLFIDELDGRLGGLLCSPFRQPVIEAVISIHRPSRFEENIQCTLDDAIENVEAFVEGDFSQGGWSGWINLVHDNPYGQFLDIELELDSRIASAVNKERTLSDWGDGFLSWEKTECDGSFENHVDPETGETIPIPNCQTVTNTPGSVIEEQINKQLGSGQRRVEVADELNEMISALMFYLIQDLLTGDEGLRGFNNSQERNRDIIIPPIEVPPTTGGGPTTPSDDAPAGPQGEPVFFELPGTFFVPTEAVPVRRVEIPVPTGVSYSRATVDMDLTLGEWQPPAGSSHNVFWFARERNRNLFGYSFLTAPPNPGVIMRHGVGQIQQAKVREGANFAFRERETYHFSYTYNTAEDFVLLVVSQNGNPVATVRSVPDTDQINVGDQRFLLDFGFEGINPNEPPTLGWEYKNLEVTFE